MRYKILFVIVIVIGIVTSASGFLFLQNKSNKDISCLDCNLIMISLSNVSAEHMSLYGYERLTTPYLDAWVEDTDAVVFENAFAQTSWTLPVATSLFTSLYPYSHKIMDRFVSNLLDESIQTLPEILRDEGYKTAAFVGGLDYDNSFGHMRGFEEYQEAMEAEEGAYNHAALLFSGFGPSLAKGLEWIENNSEEKFFVFLHGYDTHCPFDPPAETKGTFSDGAREGISVDNTICLRGFADSQSGTYEAYYYKPGEVEKVTLTKGDIMYLGDLYDEEVFALDKLVGTFLDKLEQAVIDNTIIIVFSDHGEMFAKHGRFGRAGGVRGTLYDEVVHVPLVMKVPKQEGKRVSGLVQMIDIMPTLLDVLGVPQPADLQGANLVPLVLGQRDEINQYVFTGSEFGTQEGRIIWDAYTIQSINESVRSREWKLIYESEIGSEEGRTNETYELYNLQDDPDELHNLIDEELPEAARLKEVLKAWAEGAKSYDAQTQSAPQLLPPEVIESSKKHGYW